MAIINGPTKIEPLAAIVFKRLSDARRLLNKKKERLQQAVRTFELMKKKDRRPPQGNMVVCQASNGEALRVGAISLEPSAGQDDGAHRA